MSGWIKLHRSLLDWEWYDDHNATRLLIHLLVTVNREEKKWRGITVKPGTRVTSFETLAKETGMSVKQIRVAMQKLENSQEVARERAGEGQAVTLVKWDKLQSDEEKRASHRAKGGQIEGKQRASTKEVKEVKEGEKVYRAFAHLSLSVDEYQRLISEGYAKEQIDQCCDDVENYRLNKNYISLNRTIRKWMKKDGVIPQGQKTQGQKLSMTIQ